MSQRLSSSLLSMTKMRPVRREGATFTLSESKSDTSATCCVPPIRGAATFDVALSLLSCRSAKDCRPATPAHDGLIQDLVGRVSHVGGSMDRATADSVSPGCFDGGFLPGAPSATTGRARRADVPSMAAVSLKALARPQKTRCELLALLSNLAASELKSEKGVRNAGRTRPSC